MFLQHTNSGAIITDMSRANLNPFSVHHQTPSTAGRQAIEYRVVQSRLNRILAFTGLSIDDVVNNPIAKNKLLGYFKLSRFMDRREEIVELERQWNPTGRSR